MIPKRNKIRRPKNSEIQLEKIEGGSLENSEYFWKFFFFFYLYQVPPPVLGDASGIIIDFRELKNMIEIGKGSYGVVYK